jgi:hypothetical protein
LYDQLFKDDLFNLDKSNFIVELFKGKYLFLGLTGGSLPAGKLVYIEERGILEAFEDYFFDVLHKDTKFVKSKKETIQFLNDTVQALS